MNQIPFLSNEIVGEFNIYNNIESPPPLIRRLTFDTIETPEPLDPEIEEEDPDIIVWTPEDPPVSVWIPQQPPNLIRSTNSSCATTSMNNDDLPSPNNLYQTIFHYM
jgi:hypothetical protein